MRFKRKGLSEGLVRETRLDVRIFQTRSRLCQDCQQFPLHVPHVCLFSRRSDVDNFSTVVFRHSSRASPWTSFAAARRHRNLKP